MNSQPTYDNMLLAAKNVQNALNHIGEPRVCLVGGMATRLHGVHRDVKDLDFAIIRPTKDVQSIQRALVKAFPLSFNLSKLVKGRSGNYGTSYMKLYYRIPGTEHTIKVDLLLSSVSDVEIPSSWHRTHFETIDGLKVAPLYFVLYHKLKGWNIRVSCGQKWQEDIADGKDKRDVIKLCDRAYQLQIQPLTKLEGAYRTRFETRVASFIREYNGEGTTKFRRIGLDV